MKRFLIILTILVSVAALAAWRLNATHPQSSLVLAVVKPVVGDLQTAVTATGTLYSSHSVDIKYDGQEIIEDLKVKEGDHVSAGQVLAVMDTRVLDHTRLQNQQTVEKDAASLIQAEAAFHREEALFKEGIVARTDFEVTRATYLSLIHQRQADDEGVKETTQQMERAVLRSPMNGTVVAIYVHAGEMLGSATAVAALGPNTSISKPTNVLMTVVEDGPLEVYAGVNAADLGSLATDQQAEISIDAFQPSVFHGRVRRISLEPVVVNNVTTYQAIVTLIVNLLLTSLAGVLLAVGGIGIMNIMLVAVSERTREIGVRRAVGADRMSILSQFLLESIVLSVAGSLIGVVLAVITASVAGFALHWHTPVQAGGIVVALLSATMVGVVSGIYPARRAAGLNVVDALRFE